MQNCRLAGAILRTTGDVPAVDLRSARIAGDLDRRHARVANPGQVALRLKTATVDGRTILSSWSWSAAASTSGTPRSARSGTTRPAAAGRGRVRRTERADVPGRAGAPRRDRAGAAGVAAPDAGLRGQAVPAAGRRVSRCGARGRGPPGAGRAAAAPAPVADRVDPAAAPAVRADPAVRLPTDAGGRPAGRGARDRGRAVPRPVHGHQHPGRHRVPGRGPIGLAVDSAIPLVSTGAADGCQLATGTASGHALAAAGWLLTLLGWATATLVVAGYSGWVRRR
jgi:hypothetical protein